MKISIALADDQEIIRKGIREIIHLRPEFKVVIEAENGQEMLEKLEDCQVDLIVSDIRMPVLDGVGFLQKFRAAGANTPVLMLTTFNEHAYFINALRAGCNGFLLKDVSTEKLHDTIKLVAGGGFLAEPQPIASIGEVITDAPVDEPEPLSSKEKQVLRFAAAGFSNREISVAMCLAEGTIKNHVTRILEKTHCRDRTQAVVRAMGLKII